MNTLGYTDSDALKWYEDYKDFSIPVRKVSEKHRVKQCTMLRHFKRLGLPLRPPGFRPGNTKGVNGQDLERLRYLWLYAHAYKRRARLKQLEFTLTEQQFLKIVTSACTYCGAPHTSELRKVRGVAIPMLTVDRKDSSKGYTLDNCVPACKKCNTMKLDYPVQEFLSHARKIYEHCFVWLPSKPNSFKYLNR